VYPLEPEYLRSELNPQFASVASPADVVVVTTFGIDQGGGSGDFHVCIPYAMLEPIRATIYNSVPAERSEADQRWMARLTAHVYDAEVEVRANLARASVTLGQLMTMEPGDVVAIDLAAQITADVDGIPVMRCSYGVVNGRYALKVEQPIGKNG
jgi:flagellar motor switch protein FliM